MSEFDYILEDHLTRENLISCCRYYKGEDENPYDEKEPEKSIFWFYEQCWVKFMLDDNGKYIFNISQEYEAYGLTDFEKTDGTPESLKALLFNRYTHWQSANISGFKRWYIEDYRADKTAEIAIRSELSSARLQKPNSALIFQ